MFAAVAHPKLRMKSYAPSSFLTFESRVNMIRKLKSGEFRLYSRKKDPSTRKKRNLGRSRQWSKQSNMSAKCNTSRGTESN